MNYWEKGLSRAEQHKIPASGWCRICWYLGVSVKTSDRYIGRRLRLNIPSVLGTITNCTVWQAKCCFQRLNWISSCTDSACLRSRSVFSHKRPLLTSVNYAFLLLDSDGIMEIFALLSRTQKRAIRLIYHILNLIVCFWSSHSEEWHNHTWVQSDALALWCCSRFALSVTVSQSGES